MHAPNVQPGIVRCRREMCCFFAKQLQAPSTLSTLDVDPLVRTLGFPMHLRTCVAAASVSPFHLRHKEKNPGIVIVPRAIVLKMNFVLAVLFWDPINSVKCPISFDIKSICFLVPLYRDWI